MDLTHGRAAASLLPRLVRTPLFPRLVRLSRLVRPGLALLALLVLLIGPAWPAPAEAGYLRCRSACKQRLAACKERCKRSGARWKARHSCYKRCGRGYAPCKRRCR